MKMNKRYLIFFAYLIFIKLLLTRFLPEKKTFKIWKDEYKETVINTCCDIGVFDITKKDSYIFIPEKSTVGRSRLIFTERKKTSGMFYFSNENFLYKIKWSKEDESGIEIISAFKIDNGKYIKLMNNRKKDS